MIRPASIQRAHWLWVILAAGIFLSSWAALVWEQYALFLLPAGILGIYLAVWDYWVYFFLLFFFIPLSNEVAIGASRISMPTEPIMLLLTGIALLKLPLQIGKKTAGILLHPITLLLLAHIGWMLITTLTSQQHTISVKFFLAKIWFVVPFYFLSGRILLQDHNYKKWVIATLVATLITVTVVMARHAAYGFAFEDIKWVLWPFYPNHVIYATLLTIFLPFVVDARRFFHRHRRGRWLMAAVIMYLVIAIYLSYTRAAMVSILALIGIYYLVRWHVLKYVLAAALVVAMLGIRWIIRDNRFLDYAPNYERTITNERFDKLLEATYKLEDISVMERVYRWVAAFRMVAQRPYLGFGPGTFAESYKPYTLRQFKTYVSDNPERSGLHCYYLMTAVDEGIPGLVIFLLFVFAVFYHGEEAYRLAATPERRGIAMAALLSFSASCLLLLMNDMVEVDKSGSFFFLSAGLIARLRSVGGA